MTLDTRLRDRLLARQAGMLEGLVTDTVAVGARIPDADEEGDGEGVLLSVTDAEG